MKVKLTKNVKYDGVYRKRGEVITILETDLQAFIDAQAIETEENIEEETELEPMEDITKKQIAARLDAMNIEYPANAKKEELYELLRGE